MCTIGRKKSNGSYQKEFYQQGWIYKNPRNFEKKKGVCYVSKLSDKEYTYQDFLDLCGGNEKVAKYMFELVDWQCPEFLINSDLASIGILPCEACSYFYDTESQEFCPRCGAGDTSGP